MDEKKDGPKDAVHWTNGTVDGVILKDSGARQEFSTGSRRDTRDGKGRYDLLQTRALHLVARQLEEGAKKYGERNWEKGQPLSRYTDSAMRHTMLHMQGRKDERHDVAAAWNLLSMIETTELIREGKLPRELDDIGAVTWDDLAVWSALNNGREE